MDKDRFDDLVVSLGDPESSRRAMLQRFGAGGLAALLAALGLSAGGGEEAEAGRGRKSRKRRKPRKRRRRRGGGQSQAGFNITVNQAMVGSVCTPAAGCGAGSGLTCVALLCVPIDLGDTCSTGADCSTGACTNGQCDDCDGALEVCGTGAATQCCVVDADCVGGLCVFPQ